MVIFEEKIKNDKNSLTISDVCELFDNNSFWSSGEENKIIINKVNLAYFSRSSGEDIYESIMWKPIEYITKEYSVRNCKQYIKYDKNGEIGEFTFFFKDGVLNILETLKYKKTKLDDKNIFEALNSFNNYLNKWEKAISKELKKRNKKK